MTTLTQSTIETLARAGMDPLDIICLDEEVSAVMQRIDALLPEKEDAA